MVETVLLMLVQAPVSVTGKPPSETAAAKTEEPRFPIDPGKDYGGVWEIDVAPDGTSRRCTQVRSDFPSIDFCDEFEAGTQIEWQGSPPPRGGRFRITVDTRFIPN